MHLNITSNRCPDWFASRFIGSQRRNVVKITALPACRAQVVNRMIASPGPFAGMDIRQRGKMAAWNQSCMRIHVLWHMQFDIRDYRQQERLEQT